MNAVTSQITLPPDDLKTDVECFRLATYQGSEALIIRVFPNGFPGILFQHSGPDSAITHLATDSVHRTHVPLLFVYGQIIQKSIMHFKFPFETLQVVLKPHALRSIFGLDAASLTNTSLNLAASRPELQTQLLSANKDTQQNLLINFLRQEKGRVGLPDPAIEQALDLINHDPSSLTVESLYIAADLSGRQFQKRFKQAVGMDAGHFIRIKRINQAYELMKTGHYRRLVDIAHELNFHDQSHFIRDIKAFTGIIPTNIFQNVDEFYRDQVGLSYTQNDGFLQ